MLTSSIYFTFALDSYGNVYMWGKKKKIISVPHKIVNIPKIALIAASDSLILLDHDGNLYNMRYDFYTLEPNETVSMDRTIEMFNMPERIINIDSFSYRVLFLGESGTVYEYKTNHSSPINYNNVLEINISTRVVDIAAGPGSFAIDEFGTLFSWGTSRLSTMFRAAHNLTNAMQPVTVSTPEPVIKCFNMGSYIFVIGESGKLYSIGDNTYGQLALGHEDNMNSFEEVALPQYINNNGETVVDKIISVEGSERYILALSESGYVYSSGANYGGQLGLGDTTPRNVLTYVNMPVTISSVSVNFTGGSFAVDTRGYVYAWGNNTNGSLGLGSDHRNSQYSPVQIENLRLLHTPQIKSARNVYSLY